MVLSYMWISIHIFPVRHKELSPLCLIYLPWPREQENWLRISGYPICPNNPVPSLFSVLSQSVPSLEQLCFLLRNPWARCLENWAKMVTWSSACYPAKKELRRGTKALIGPSRRVGMFRLEGGLMQEPAGHHHWRVFSPCFWHIFCLSHSNQGSTQKLMVSKIFVSLFRFDQGQERSTRWNLTTKERVFCQETTLPTITTLLTSCGVGSRVGQIQRWESGLALCWHCSWDTKRQKQAQVPRQKL